MSYRVILKQGADLNQALAAIQQATGVLSARLEKGAVIATVDTDKFRPDAIAEYIKEAAPGSKVSFN